MASQGAGRNSGQAAGSNRFVKFSHGAAQRIAKAVRVVEGGNRDQPGIVFDHPMPGGGGKVFRVCTYTGSWSIGSSKVVTFKYQSATPNTVSASNLFFPVTSTATGSRDCAVAKDGTAWFLIDVVAAVTATAVVRDITLSASLNTSACTITVSKTLNTTLVTFVEFGV